MKKRNAITISWAVAGVILLYNVAAIGGVPCGGCTCAPTTPTALPSGICAYRCNDCVGETGSYGIDITNQLPGSPCNTPQLLRQAGIDADYKACAKYDVQEPVPPIQEPILIP
jgi:hypothetical protein